MSWRGYFQRTRRDEDLASEIDSYIRHEHDDNIARGLSEEEAWLAAQRRFGNTALVREDVYQMNTMGLIDALRKDFKYALRQLRQHPGFALTAIISLALGVGANTAIFTLSDQILLRLLPVEKPEELVQLRAEGGRAGAQTGDGLHTFSHPTFLALQKMNTVFTGLTGQSVETASMTGADRSEMVNVGVVAGNFFDVLGVKSYQGKLLTPADDVKKNGSPVAVLQYGFWQSRFAGRPDVLGSTIRLNGVPFTVVGITAPSFEGTDVGSPTNLWIPVTMRPAIRPADAGILEDERFAWFYLFGRLKPGISISQAEAAMKVTYRQRQQEELNGTIFQKFPDLRDRFMKQNFTLAPAARGGQSFLRFRFEQPLILLHWLVGAVLLIACLNVAGLLLARAAARQREMAIRGALGAARGQLIRQLLVESLLLAIGGGVTGIIISGWITDLLVRMVAADPSRISLSTTPDLRVMLFAITLTLLTTLLFGLLPAWQASQTPAAATLKESAGSLAGNVSQVRLRKLFVAFQVGASTLLVISAGLFAKTLHNLRNTELGMKTENVATFSVRLAVQYDDNRKLQLYRGLMETLAAVPGVTAVGANNTLLFTGGRSDGSITVPGADAKAAALHSSFFNTVTPGYLEALGVPIKLGRDFSWKDWGSSRLYCLVNEALVSEYFEGRNPVGRMIGRGRGVPADTEIIGVFANSRYDTVRGAIPRQILFSIDNRLRFATGVNVYARIQGDPRSTMPQLREQVARFDSNLVLSGMRTMDDQLNLLLANERILSFLSIGFALLAAMLAVTGLYGVLTFVVARRSREIGIRMALGAQQSGVIRLVLREMLFVIAGGIATGIAAGLLAGRFLESQLYGVQATDAGVLVISATLLAVCSICAALLPAWRAARLDPTAALRE